MSYSAAGKGSGRRPSELTIDELDKRWAMAFGNKEQKTELSVVPAKHQLFIIVKYAQDGVWNLYWQKDPKKLLMLPNASAHDTYSGHQCKLKENYTTVEEAQIDCDRINESNPSGAYAVCKLG